MDEFFRAQGIVPDNPFPVTRKEVRRENDGNLMEDVQEGAVEPFGAGIDAVHVDGGIVPVATLEGCQAGVEGVPAGLGLEGVSALDRIPVGLENDGAKLLHLVLDRGLDVLDVLLEFGIDLRKGH